MAPRLRTLFHLGPPFDPSHRFETSALLPTGALGCARAVIALYAVATIVVAMAVRAEPTPAQSFSYFSNITWWGIAGYHCAATLHTLVLWRRARRAEGRGSEAGGEARAPLEEWHPALQAAHSLLWTSVATYPLMVTLVFWSLQYTPEKFADRADAWSNVSHHALNSLFALFEIVFARTERPPWIHAPIILILLGGYAGIAYITHTTEGFYTYGFLNPSRHSPGTLAGIIVGMGALCLVLFVVVWLLVWLRLWVTETLLRLGDGEYAGRGEDGSGGERLGSVGTEEDCEKEEQERVDMVSV